MALGKLFSRRFQGAALPSSIPWLLRSSSILDFDLVLYLPRFLHGSRKLIELSPRSATGRRHSSVQLMSLFVADLLELELDFSRSEAFLMEVELDLVESEDDDDDAFEVEFSFLILLFSKLEPFASVLLLGNSSADLILLDFEVELSFLSLVFSNSLL